MEIFRIFFARIMVTKGQKTPFKCHYNQIYFFGELKVVIWVLFVLFVNKLKVVVEIRAAGRFLLVSCGDGRRGGL